jgi:hypothetical protein
MTRPDRAIVSAEVRAAKAERARNTYLAHAQADADMAAGGRYAKVEATRVTGVPVYPALPAGSPFHHDPVPSEPQLGVDVNAMEPIGTAREIDQSIRDLGGPLSEAPVVAGPAATVETERGPPIPSILRRRAR